MADIVYGSSGRWKWFSRVWSKQTFQRTYSASLSAVKNMDWVERFEKRTIWTEMETKYGATHLILRPRLLGLG